MNTAIGILGIVVLLGIGYLLSENRRAINLRTVVLAFTIELALGGLILYSPAGQHVLFVMAEAVTTVINFNNAGTSFIFGGLVSDKMFEIFGSGGFVIALRVLPIIVFFSALSAVLYYLGIMQILVRWVGGALQRLLKTSRAESMNSAANIFLGVTEAPLLVKPYLGSMTRSELFAVLCGGLASIAGTMLVSYASLGVKMEYLLAASFMAAPGGLLFAKLMIPETQQTADESGAKPVQENRPANIIDAAAEGAINGLNMALAVGAMLLAFVSLVALLNGLLGGVGGWFGLPDLSMELILGYLLSPMAWLMGIPWNEALTSGAIIGQKIVINEFFAYANLAEYLKGNEVVAATGLQMTERTQIILSFALCGFANFGTVAIAIGGIGSLIPNRRKEIATLGMKALVAGVLSNLMAATIAGLFIGG
ncbi:NupC/NupG family nucleoside CNT transporter [Morganella morganii subsp. morganii]|uniref:NupC/NupG family nucleoside CNT transporter n=1 Tax=Morganella morganii TaxID=582 RepID=UPI0015F3A34D|nr:NupC/NupG family nucleoside CNT transporter [Morganella morganii]ELA8473776.1 NupC/NupG family nucleoside CNT transporter [Morganella morganii]MBT0447248.1 NupC/NupG family nucleoside CNT transporter [Morganella morganii subsp. morganii]MBT0449532.1 NupC/NupG family nucleoside CNT transporter [Morganella morganii subsp. morganii]MBT0506953.1 NupC/NupG family nucleoside CNT transporter [Morganella morganii subsp. morganii]MDT5424604.1 NupC/NupG family nucleoside CNT transporter [Morganella m